MVLYYVAMLDIPKDVLESAQIDGANRWHLIRYFYLPLTRGTTEINLILTITGCLRAFDIFYLLTSGGPGTSTKVVSMWIMETAFQSYKYGRALAMSIVLFVIVVFTMVIFRLLLTPREKEGEACRRILYRYRAQSLMPNGIGQSAPSWSRSCSSSWRSSCSIPCSSCC